MQIRDFLQAILPVEGWYYAVRIQNDTKRTRHAPTKSPSQLAKACKLYSQEGDDAYFALASFREKGYRDHANKWRTRKTPNFRAIRCIALDIDCGPGKPYAAKVDAIKALGAFLKQTQLPKPRFIVDSGNGFHVYWTFCADITNLTDWRRVATLVHRLTQALQFEVDPAVTHDAMRILRVPGTRNYKDPDNPVAVKVVQQGSEVAFGAFLKAAVQAGRTLGVAIPSADELRVTTRAPGQAGGNAELDELMGHFESSDPEKIARLCQTIGHMRDTQGADQCEPEWYQCLGVLRLAEDGRAIAHEWSKGHPGYASAETDAKLDQWEGGPASCEEIRNAQGSTNHCEGCPLQVWSPLFLGRASYREHQQSATSASGQVETLPTLPDCLSGDFGFTVEQGLQWSKWEWNKAEKKFEVREVFLTMQFPVVSFLWYEESTEEFYAHVRTRYRFNEWQEADIKLSSMGQGGATLSRDLAGRAGIMIMNLDGMSKYMRTWADYVRRNTSLTVVSRQQGWQADGSFQLADKRYYEDGNVATTVVAKELSRYIEPMKPRGSLERYVEIIDELYNRPGYEHYQLFVLASFGSPLMYLLKQAPVGVSLAAFSKETGQGKSAVCHAGLAVWGDPTAYGQAAVARNATDHGFLTMAGLRHDLPVLLDEATEWNSKVLSNFLYNFAEGRGKVQGHSDGGLRDNAHLNWSTVCYMTSNKSIVDIVAGQVRNSIPQASRVLQVEFTPRGLDPLKSYLFQDLFANSGQAGPVFMRYVVKNKAKIRQMVLATQEKLIKATGAGTEARYWLAVLSVSLVAGVIGAKLKLHAFNLSALFKLSVQLLSDSMGLTRELVETAEDLLASLLTDLHGGLIVTYNLGDNRPQSKNPARFPPDFSMPRYMLTGRVVLETGRVYIPVQGIRDWCAKTGIGFTTLREIFQTDKILLGTAVRASLTKGLPAQSTVSRCWLIQMPSALVNNMTPPQEAEVVNLDQAREDRVKEAQGG